MKCNFVSVIICFSALVTGCSINNVERISPVPDFFIQFEQDKAELNNKYLIKEKINKVAKGVKEDEKIVWVVVASGNSAKDYSLAVRRMYNFSNAIQDEDVRVVIQPLERKEQVNMVAVYHTAEWNDKSKAFFLDNEFSKLISVDGVYRSSDKRLFYATPTKRKLLLSGKGVITQFDNALHQLGWSLDATNANWSYEKQFSVPSVEVILLGDKATEYEINLLAKTFIEKALAEHEFDIDFENRTVRLWQSLDFNGDKT